MKQFPQKVLFYTLLTMGMFCLPCFLYADPVDPCVDPLLYCPIDNWMYVLLAIGILYGIKKNFGRNKKFSED